MYLRVLILFFTLLLPCRALLALESYDVEFQGNISTQLQELLETSSILISQKASPPATTAGLRHRAEADSANLIKVLHSQAFYNGQITLKYDLDRTPPLITLTIDTGPTYPLANFSIQPALNSCTFPYDTITLEDLDVTLGAPALPENILHAEERLIALMEARGYPLATIEKREVVADQKSKSISVTLHVNSGPTVLFGGTTVTGITSVKESFFSKKIAWKPGQTYNPCLIERTQNALEASGLFSSISIIRSEEVLANNTIPMQIEVIERKHRSIGGGLAYMTQRGAGLTAEWEHRNIFGSGEKLSFEASVWGDLQELTLLYVEPDFDRRAQDLLWSLECRHETTKGFIESSLSLSRIIERQLNENTRISYGGMYKRLRDTHSDGNGEFNLFKIPLHLRWSNADSLLDPSSGATLNFRATPSLQFPDKPFGYCINTLTTTFYHSLMQNNRYVLATKVALGSIWGSSRRTIPASERFYEGSENSLRGYRFLTVSPLNEHNKPIGGRSLVILSQELRIRATKSFGWVFFYDIGNVYRDPWPALNHKVLQSVGFGIRYHTPVGPLRLDLAVPLNRRPALDSRFQVYLSIGQAF